ncbi:class I SAM-dependent methyltransferase [Blastopirellula marina]|uniref:SAM-dependent methyltransferase n=1 Tax=Blastopirellula marina TaxID=124 RepID=A0A2S8G9L0_9BACT|nr:methyltransferase domain-containing protein [Blastopirellula marina]PQO41117.1 SAM-dependent methyltransferase [Blastopirellula marina]PTL45993.1 methyltransferase domain-containing protein [Blastopirellula marina]
MRIAIWAIVTFSLVSAPLFAQETAPSKPQQSVKPGINDNFLDPDLKVEEWVKRFEVESREIFHGRDEIIQQLKLKPGDRIADIGTGTGLFIEPFSKAVGQDGWVYALDIAPKFVERVGKLAKEYHLENVTPVVCGEDDVRLAPRSIDVAFICDVYHHFEYPQPSLASIHKALVPGGQLVVIDFNRIPGKSRDWTLSHVRAGKEEFRKEIEDAGFEFVEEVKISAFKENYFLRFTRK